MSDDMGEALSLLRDMTEQARCVFEHPTDSWQITMHEIESWCKKNLVNSSRVMLTKEDELTDTSAWFVIFCAPLEVGEIIKRWPTAICTIPQIVSREPEPIPEWLTQFTAKYSKD